MKIQNNNLKIPTGVLLILAAFAVLNGCSSYTQIRTPDEAGIPNLLYSLPPGEFGKIWLQRTVQLTIKGDGSSSIPLIGGASDEQSRGNRLIPMDINVTYMDTAVVNAGLREFENLADMSASEKAEFENRYKSRVIPEDSYVFWMELTSIYSEDALGTQKWTFYIEDENGNRYEPRKITKVESMTLPGISKQQDIAGIRGSEMQRGNLQRASTRAFLLNFSKKGYNGNDILKNVKTLKMVYFEWSTRELKREGTLDLSSIKL